jgi:transposase-like protein
MRVLADGRVRRTRSEWQTILKRFARSGLTVTAFCEREEISPSVFAAWRRKFGETKVKEPRFVELAPPSAAAPAGPTVPAAGAFELSLPGGVVLRWKA